MNKTRHQNSSSNHIMKGRRTNDTDALALVPAAVLNSSRVFWSTAVCNQRMVINDEEHIHTSCSRQTRNTSS